MEDRIRSRLERENIIWFATVKPNGKPHLVPLWFVLDNDNIIIWTSKQSVKYRNLQNSKFVSISLEDGKHPVIGQGHSIRNHIPTDSTDLVDLFDKKYDWNDTSGTYDIMVRIFITTWI